MFVYVLSLEESKFYVGKTDNVEVRYAAHLAGTGSAWTKKYKPVGILKVEPADSDFDEDKMFKSMVAEHGIDNVRGAAYSKIVLSDTQRAAIQAEIWGATGKCIRCGRGSHFVASCYATRDVNNLLISKSARPRAEPVNKSEDVVLFGERICIRCLRTGHCKNECYATTTVFGFIIDTL